MTTKKQAIGVFDSGVGGLTALRKLAELLPQEDLLYLGDTARVPYGSRSEQTIQLYAKQCVEFLLAHSVKLILVACNTASAVALPLLQKLSPVPIVGVIKPTVQAAMHHHVNINPRHIGIIGTHATIQSKTYEQEIQRHHSAHQLIHTHALACPLFVPLAEEGWHDHAATYAIAKEYLAPLQEVKLDTLILGCTHYPLLKKVIHDLMPGVLLIDSSEEAAIAAAHLVQKTDEAKTLREITCYTTDHTAIFTRFVEELVGGAEIRKVSL